MKKEIDIKMKDKFELSKIIIEQNVEIFDLNQKMKQAMIFAQNRVFWWYDHNYKKIGIHNVENLLDEMRQILGV